MGAGVLEDGREVPGEDSGFGVSVVAADLVHGEVAEVFDEDFFGEGEQTDECGELLVVSGLADVVIATVEPVDEELK